MKESLLEFSAIVIITLSCITACTVIIGNDNAPSQVDDNDNDNEILTGLGE